jgi:hypothetical protein
MSSPDITQAEIDAVLGVLNTRWLSLGPRIVEFEEKLPPTPAPLRGGRQFRHGRPALAMIAAGVQEATR